MSPVVGLLLVLTLFKLFLLVTDTLSIEPPVIWLATAFLKSVSDPVKPALAD
jgi:hypothetical protein